MSQNFRPNLANFTSFPNYNASSYSSFDTAQHPYYGFHRASDPGLLPQNKQQQEDGLDLSGYDAIAQASAPNVQVEDVIKPEEVAPWSGPQQAVYQRRQLPQLPIFSSYARTEPARRQDLFSDGADSGYQTQPQTAGPVVQNDFNWNKEELERNHQPFLADPTQHDLDNKSIVSDGRIIDNRVIRGSRDHRRKVPPTPCGLCRRIPKNLSDAKKHELTHTKPFHCTVHGCIRKDGFATDNDLQRHRKSVHKLQPTVGNPAGYVCVACPVPDDGQPKFWPRRDNFKAHIKRKHAQYDEESLINRSKQNVRPDDARTADDDARTVRSAMQSAAQHSQIDADESHGYQQLHPASALSRNTSEQGSYTNNLWPSSQSPVFNSDEVLVGIGHNGDMHHYATPSTRPNGTGHLNMLSDNFDIQDSSQFTQQPPNKRSRPSHIDGFSHDFANLNHETSYNLPNSQTVATSNNPTQQRALSPPPSSAGDVQCPECGKLKKRDCDLKKHMKRHTRPYGCTFPECLKKFGSRNDWKRHETGQHFLQEMWKCQRLRCDGTKCARRPFHQLEILKKHLRGPDHGMTDEMEIDAECKAFRLGRDGHDHYWCGFCNALISQSKELANAFEERFKHIGDHFDKNGCDSLDWVCIDENKAKRFITEKDRKEAKLRAKQGFREDDEELPEYMPDAFGAAGIPNNIFSVNKRNQGDEVEMTGMSFQL